MKSTEGVPFGTVWDIPDLRDVNSAPALFGVDAESLAMARWQEGCSPVESDAILFEFGLSPGELG